MMGDMQSVTLSHHLQQITTPLASLLHEPDCGKKIQLARKAFQPVPVSVLIETSRPSEHNQSIEQVDVRPCPWDISAVKEQWDQLPATPARPPHFTILDAGNMPRRPSPLDPVGAAMLVHALAQIEMAAIEIDAAQILLYPQAPTGWQHDMLSIIQDECDHFEALCELLNTWSTPFGTFPIHHGLWMGFLAGRTWLEHLALTTRYQEANGVDASRELINRIEQSSPKLRMSKALSLLEKLHLDEIRHVAIGSRWWHYAFQKGGVWPSLQLQDEASCNRYFEIIESRVPKPWSRRFPFYIEGRAQAGFNANELKIFESLQDSRRNGIAKPPSKNIRP